MRIFCTLKHKLFAVFAALFFLYGSMGTVHAYYHEHVNHACPKNKKNPTAACPGHHKPPSDKEKATTHGGVDTIGCGCQSSYDVLMCFFGY